VLLPGRWSDPRIVPHPNRENHAWSGNATDFFNSLLGARLVHSRPSRRRSLHRTDSGPLSLGGWNRSSCAPVAAIEGAIGERAQRPQSNTLRAPFDNPESRLSGRERNVVGHYRLGEPLQRERTNLYGYDASL
jgi:hypothetical protein